jgi:DNA polymerase III epsilon subunit family exonuclease
MRYIVWDLETTGLNPYHDQIIEIAAVDNYGSRFETLIRLDTGKPLSAKVKELTGITEKMLENKPALSEVLGQFVEFIRGTDYLIGHNSIRFDYLFLKTALRRFRPDTDLKTLECIRQLDTMLIYQSEYPCVSSFSLATLCKCFSIPHDSAHRAMGDVSATRALFERILRVREQTCEMLYNLT